MKTKSFKHVSSRYSGEVKLHFKDVLHLLSLVSNWDLEQVDVCTLKQWEDADGRRDKIQNWFLVPL